MNIVVRFYWQHDLDLVALAAHPDFDLSHWIKRTVIAAVRGDTGFYIPLPRKQPFPVKLDDCSIHFVLNPSTESDVIDFLKGIRCGFRNSAIKLIFRQYLSSAYVDPFFNEQLFDVKARGRKTNKKKQSSTPNLITKTERENNLANGYFPTDILKHTSLPENATDSNTIETPEPSTKKEPLEVTIPEPTITEPVQEPTIDLGQEENTSEPFDLFSAIDKLM